MGTEILREVISEEQIRRRVGELGEEITADFAGTRMLMVVCVLKGAFMFAADLVRSIRVPCRIEFIRASSYGSGRESSGSVTITDTPEVEGCDVLLVEDIIDTGLTIERIAAGILKQRPASLKICTLLDKPSARKQQVRAEYSGFSVSDVFVAGYGLDCAGRYRELPFIAEVGER